MSELMWNCIFILIKLIKQYIFFGEKIKPFSLNMYTYAFINLRTTKHVLHQAELHSFTFDTNKEVPDGQREDDEDAVLYTERLISPESAGWLVFQLDYTKLLKRFFHQTWMTTSSTQLSVCLRSDTNKDETSVWGGETLFL